MKRVNEPVCNPILADQSEEGRHESPLGEEGQGQRQSAARCIAPEGEGYTVCDSVGLRVDISLQVNGNSVDEKSSTVGEWVVSTRAVRMNHSPLNFSRCLVILTNARNEEAVETSLQKPENVIVGV